MADWYTVEDGAAQERLLAAWPDAPLVNLEVCSLILTTAREQVEQYGPEPVEEVTVVDGYVVSATVTPDRYVYAQLRQAQTLYNAGRASGDGDVGPDGFSFTPRPLDKTIRDIIRPKDIRPHVL